MSLPSLGSAIIRARHYKPLNYSMDLQMTYCQMTYWHLCLCASLLSSLTISECNDQAMCELEQNKNTTFNFVILV